MEATAYQQFLELEREHWWFRGRRTVYLGLLEHHLGGERPPRILDLGCGVGGFLGGLARLGGRVFPTDISAESLVRCRERGFPGGVVSSGYALPYATAAFDLVCLFDAIEHIEDDARVLREVARILKPGGLVMLTQSAIKTSLAWSTVAQMGFMVLQCGLALFPLALLHIVCDLVEKELSAL